MALPDEYEDIWFPTWNRLQPPRNGSSALAIASSKALTSSKSKSNRKVAKLMVKTDKNKLL